METVKPECNGTVAGDTQPNAYLNYILFDQNYKVMDMGWTAVPSSANFAQQKISIPTVTAKEAGYIFVYLSYEDQSNNWVYFDDFKVTFTPTSILQSNEYYPFGLQTANSWTRDNTVTNNFLANGGTELNTVSALYDLQYRNYDAALGRFHQVDPLSDRYGSHTPYNYAFGNPVSMNDPNGAGLGDSGTDNVCSLMQAMGMMHYSPYENHHYDADHEDPGIGYYLNGEGGDMFGDIPFGGGFFGVSNSTSVNQFINNAWNGNGGTWSDGNAHYYSASEAASRDITLNGAFDSWSKSQATMYAKCPTCPGGDKYKAYVDAPNQTFYYEDGVVTNTPGFSQSGGNGSDFIYDNNNAIGLGLEIAENGTSEAIQAVVANPALYTAGAKVGATTLGTAVIGLNVAVTGYTIANEIQGKNGASVNTHTWVNGGVALLTTAATGVGIAFAGATAPVWVPVVAIGGAVVGVGYAVAQVAGIDTWIDKNFGYK